MQRPYMPDEFAFPDGMFPQIEHRPILPPMSRLRSLHRGFLNLLRSRGAPVSIAALSSILIIAQVFLVLGLSGRIVAAFLSTNNTFSLQLRDGAADRDTQQFLVAARQLPFVTGVALITREKAMALTHTAHPEIAALLEKSAMNPFHDTAVVTLGSLTSVDEFSAFAQHPRWQNVVDPVALAQIAARRSEIQSTLWFAHAAITMAFVLSALATAALFLTVLDLIRRKAAARRDDLFVERMMGAEEASIVLPFAVEATLLLAVALALSVGFVVLFLFDGPSVASVGNGVMAAVREDLVRYGPVFIMLEGVVLAAMAMIGAWWAPRYAQRSALSYSG